MEQLGTGLGGELGTVRQTQQPAQEPDHDPRAGRAWNTLRSSAWNAIPQVVEERGGNSVRNSGKKKESVALTMAGANGGSLRRGNPGNKGGGRLRDEFRQKLRELVSRDETWA